MYYQAQYRNVCLKLICLLQSGKKGAIKGTENFLGFYNKLQFALTYSYKYAAYLLFITDELNVLVNENAKVFFV